MPPAASSRVAIDRASRTRGFFRGDGRAAFSSCGSPASGASPEARRGSEGDVEEEDKEGAPAGACGSGVDNGVLLAGYFCFCSTGLRTKW